MKDKSLAQLKKEIFLRNVAGRWKTVLNTDKKVYVLSPYITSVAEKILENVKNVGDCEIYTTFEIENFVFGSSSLKTLKNLFEKGFKIYFVPQLHAKIILVADTFVSIGSQNLTIQGTKNKEATFTSTSLEAVKFVENELIEWIKDSKEISLEMIEETEKEIRPLKKLFKKLKGDIEKVEEFVIEKENQREIERKEKIEYEKRIAILKAKVREIEKTQVFVRGSVKSVESQSYSYFGKNYSNVWTFMPYLNYGSDLLNWRINLERKSLQKTFYCLALVKDTGKLGWARVTKTRITYFQQGVGSSEININGTNYEIAFVANWNWEELRNTNLVIQISKHVDSYNYKCEIHLWFDKDLDIIKTSSSGLDFLENWINENPEIFKSIIIKRLLTPFKYKKNLSEKQADKFLKKLKNYKLRLGEINNYPFLLFSEN